MRSKIALFALLSVAVLAYAVATPLTVPNFKINNYAVQPGDLTLSFVPCDPVNGNSYVATGTEILLVQNTDSAAAHAFSVISTPDKYGRLDTSLTGYSVAASGLVAIQLKEMDGWLGPGDVITLGCNSALVNFAVLRYQQ